MSPVKKDKRRKASKPRGEQLNFTLEPGTKLRITIEAGRPIAVKREARRSNRFVNFASRLKTVVEPLARRIKRYDLAVWLLIGTLALYLVTRLIGLTQYPIYFFTDEAIQTQSIADLAANQYRDAAGRLLPTYFKNGEYSNLSLSVYLQLIPFLLFGKSAVVTRATSVFITLIAALSVGLILRDVLKIKHWWAGILFLSITPAWFLHSRTAFETAEFTALFAGTLCAYLFYRHMNPRYLYLALFLGALSFYTYSPGQLLVPLTALALLVSDWRYHWKNRETVLKGFALLVVLALPFIRFRIDDPDNAVAHLHMLGSYLLEDIPLSQKIAYYFSEYMIGLSAWYWYIPNDRDLARHLMKDYGNIMVATLPFAILGLARVLFHIRESAHRAILIVFLVSPAATALVQTGITRALVFVVPAALLTALGLELVLQWVEHPSRNLAELNRGSGFTRQRVITAAAILLLGSVLAWLCTKNIDRIAIFSLAAILALQISGVWKWLAKRMKRTRTASNLKRWNPSQIAITLTVFVALSAANVYLLTDALKNGPLWFNDYGMGGMQYGAFQIFDVLKEYKQEHPETRIIFSPNWANGTDVVSRFFVNDPMPFELGSIQGLVIQEFPLDDNILFVMLREEYDLALNSGRFKDIHVERTFLYPDGTPGFYFVRLRYADNVHEIFAAEKAARAILQESTIKINGEDVGVRHTYLDAGDQQNLAIQHVFDNDPYSLAKTFEANPFVIELTFPTPRTMNGFSIIAGSAKIAITLKCYSSPDAQPMEYKFEGQGVVEQPQLSFDLPEPVTIQVLYLEMLDVQAGSPANDHIWEVTLH